MSNSITLGFMEQMDRTRLLPETTRSLLQYINDHLVISEPDPPPPRSNKSSFGPGKNKSYLSQIPLPSKTPIKPITNNNTIAALIIAIQTCINKLTDKNYDIQYAQMANAYQLCNDETKPTVILDLVYKTAAANRNSAVLYSRLVGDLSSRLLLPVTDHLTIYIHKFEAAITEIEAVSPETDYDGFCAYTKHNDRQRAATVFLVQLSHECTILDSNILAAILYRLLLQIILLVELPNKLTDVENISEIIILLVPVLGKSVVYKSECTDMITNIGQFTAREKASFSSRVMFKYRDINTLLCRV